MKDRRAAILQFNQGSEQATAARQGKGDLSLAYQLHASSVMSDGTFGMGWHELGNDLGDMGHSAAAIASHRRAIELPNGTETGDMIDGFRVKSLCNMAHRLHVIGQNKEALQYANEALLLDPKHPNAWCVMSLIVSVLGNHDLAVETATRALEFEPDNATFEMALAFGLMYRGDMKEGLKHYEARYRYKLKHFLSYPYPQWHGEEGKTVFLVSDQGIGDTLSFARFLPMAAARCKFMHCLVHKELVRLFRASFQHIPNIDIVPSGVQFPSADAWSTFVSLPTELDLSEQEIRETPSITIPQFAVGTSWKDSDRFNIGVAWRGSAASDIDHWRSFDISYLLRLYEVPGIQLYSLQVGDKVAELHNTGCAAVIRDLSPFISDIADTTAIIREMDLIVTVESALGHIAGACGKETWIPYSRRGRDYRAGHDGSKPMWYPKHRFFRQHEDFLWTPVFDDIVAALREKVR